MTTASLTDRVEGLRYLVFLFLYAVTGLSLPFVLIPIVAVSGHSPIVEECAKAAIILSTWWTLSAPRHRLIVALIVGVAFGLSESILYLINILQFSAGTMFFGRLMLTLPMHVATVLLMVFSLQWSKYAIFLGLLAGIAIHLGFNAII